MSQKTRAQLAAGVAANYPDNTAGTITPSLDRTQHTDENDSSLILAETALQTVLGTVNFTGTLQSNGVTITGSPYIIVSAEAEFPTQDATTITLESKKIYFLTADISTTKRFVCEDGAVLTAGNFKGPILTYTGTGDMFTGSDVNFSIVLVRINHPNAAQAFNFTDTVGGIYTFIWNRVQHVSGAKIGTFNNMQFVSFVFGGAFAMDDGITLTGVDMVIFQIKELFIESTSATFKGVDLGSAISQTTEMTDLDIVAPAGAFGISGLASSGNIPTGRIGTVNNCEFQGGLTSLENITNADVRWNFKSNSPIPDTIQDALISLTSNATETVIATINTPVLVAGTWVCERQSLFTCTTAGRATLTSERDVILPVDITTTISAASGTNKDISVYLALNGTVIANSVKKNKVGASDPRSTSVLWQLNLTTGDYLEVFVENNSDTINLVIEDAILRAR